MVRTYLLSKLQERRAQILLPAVLLAPIFILVVYLLFETAKVSVTKVRNQFALDNSAYSQLSSTSTYLNAVAMTNGPLPFRFLYDTSKGKKPLDCADGDTGQNNCKSISVFNLFYQSGAVPGLLGKTGEENNSRFRPAPESTDWKVEYVKKHPDADTQTEKKIKDLLASAKESSKGGGGEGNLIISRDAWMRESPQPLGSNDRVLLLSYNLVDTHKFPATGVAIPELVNYLTAYTVVGGTYQSQDYVYRQEIKNMDMFRKAYFLNVGDCKQAECARESAAKLRPFLDIATTPMELDNVLFFFKEGNSGGLFAYPTSIKTDLLNGVALFQFAYLTPSSRSRLRQLQRGILLKQSFKLPLNHFNIDLAKKYEPYVRNKVALECPRGNNNCVWPNPLPKYNITLDP